MCFSSSFSTIILPKFPPYPSLPHSHVIQYPSKMQGLSVERTRGTRATTTTDATHEHGLHIRRDGDWVTSPLGVNSHAKEEMSTTIGMGAYAHGLVGSLAVHWWTCSICPLKDRNHHFAIEH